MVIRNIISNEDRILIKNWFEIQEKIPDSQAMGTICIRGDDFLQKYLNKYKSILENDSGFILKERFNGIRLYKRGDSLERHVDNAADFAMTAIVYQSDTKDNPLVVYTNPPQLILLQEGDGAYFEGTVVEHERLEVQSDEILHIYMGYDILKRDNKTYPL